MCLLDAREKVCPFCGFNEDVYFIEKNKNALMPGVILKDRYLIGKVLDQTNPGVDDPTKLDYTWPLIMLASLGVAALLLGLLLKVVDKKKKLGLEEPNIKPEEKPAEA